jgi:hypothetical protein
MSPLQTSSFILPPSLCKYSATYVTTVEPTSVDAEPSAVPPLPQRWSKAAYRVLLANGFSYIRTDTEPDVSATSALPSDASQCTDVTLPPPNPASPISRFLAETPPSSMSMTSESSESDSDSDSGEYIKLQEEAIALYRRYFAMENIPWPVAVDEESDESYSCSTEMWV